MFRSCVAFDVFVLPRRGVFSARPLAFARRAERNGEELVARSVASALKKKLKEAGRLWPNVASCDSGPAILSDFSMEVWGHETMAGLSAAGWEEVCPSEPTSRAALARSIGRCPVVAARVDWTLGLPVHAAQWLMRPAGSTRRLLVWRAAPFPRPALLDPECLDCVGGLRSA